MSMSTSIYGIKPPDETWKKMKAVYDACEAAKVGIPENVLEFFGYDAPSNHGVIVDLEDTPAVSELDEEGCAGFVVDLSKLPEGVTMIRFVNSW